MLAIAASEACGQPFALINADVFIADTSLRKRFINMQRGEVYFSRRIDIETLEQREGAPFKFGYDFFVAHADDISGVNSCMVFGAPWWDHFFPLTMHMRDTKDVCSWSPD